jgi:hypothetical protein
MTRLPLRSPLDVPLRCRCGHVQGRASAVSPSKVLRFICYCRDCQAFARFLQRLDVLDHAGGTDIVHMAAGQITLTAGSDALRCLRLAANSRVLRWYTECCSTPVGNSAIGSRFPAIALIHTFMDHDAVRFSRNDVLGPPICRIYESSATGPLAADAPPPLGTRVVLRRASRLFSWWLRGLGRPSPFFDSETNDPLAVPRVLSDSERTAVQREET